MKALIVGDVYIGPELMKENFKSWADKGIELTFAKWELKDIAELTNLNLKLEIEGPEAVEPPGELYDLIADKDILITQFTPVNRKLIDCGKNLKAVGTVRAGMENVCVDYITEKGIMMFNNPGRNAEAVSDFSVAMMLAENRNIARSFYSLKNGDWRRSFTNSDYCPDFLDCTFGIVGFGMIGQMVAKKLSGFTPGRLLAFDPYCPPEVAKELGTELVDLDTLMKESDFISVNARLTEENEHMIGEKQIGLMKPTAYIVNTARSGLIDEEALYNALKDKRIGGAALDVFDKEPIGLDHFFLELDNCTVTAHIAGTTSHAVTKAAGRLAREMGKLFDGEQPRCFVNRGKVEFKPLNI